MVLKRSYCFKSYSLLISATKFWKCNTRHSFILCLLNSKSLNSIFFLDSCNNIFLDSETFFSSLKYFSRFWIFFLELEIFSTILKTFFSISFFFFFLTLNYFSRFQSFVLDCESFFLMAAIGHHTFQILYVNIYSNKSFKLLKSC